MSEKRDPLASVAEAPGVFALSCAAIGVAAHEGLQLRGVEVGLERVEPDVRAMALAVAAFSAAMFTTIVTSSAVLFGLTLGERIRALFSKFGHTLVNGLAGDALVTLVAACLSGLSVGVDRPVAEILIVGSAAGSAGAALHFGATLWATLLGAMGDIRDAEG